MDIQPLSLFVVMTLVAIISIVVTRRCRTTQAAKTPEDTDLAGCSAEPTRLSKRLASVLPDNVLLPTDAGAFRGSMNSYWAQQECEVVPACVVRPRDARQLCRAISVLKQEFDERGNRNEETAFDGLFAVRSGGHSPVSGAASIRGGVVIDLGLFNEVTPSEDGSSVILGTGAKWMDVSKTLDERGLAVVGGRNSAVGVGGLTLGVSGWITGASAYGLITSLSHELTLRVQIGGLSFFSPRYGLVCSNILSYEVVLASGSIVTASKSSNPDLWRALKGGANNFGIVTRFTARSFPCTKIWSGFLYMPAFQAPKVLAAFHDCIGRANPDDPSTMYDSNAAGPLTCFSYVQQLGIQIIAVNLVYTKLSENQNEKKWPAWWKTTSFGSLWRFWSTCTVRTLTSSTDEMSVLNPPGRRQVFATTTVKNDLATITAAHAVYLDAIASIRRANVKGMVWTLVLQPLLPDWIRKGDPNPLGLHDSADGPLVIVSFTVNWHERRDDGFVTSTTRRAVEQIDTAAQANTTGHRYRFLNYCADWQRPFEGYGEENHRFLQDVSSKYDPEGLFQRGCVGGFKLGMVLDGQA